MDTGPLRSKEEGEGTVFGDESRGSRVEMGKKAEKLKREGNGDVLAQRLREKNLIGNSRTQEREKEDSPRSLSGNFCS